MYTYIFHDNYKLAHPLRLNNTNISDHNIIIWSYDKNEWG